MAQRDYVSRGRSGAARRKTPSRKRRSSSKVSKAVVALAVALLVVFIGGLYFIKHNKPEDTPLLPSPGTRPGNGLPPKPEERWRYIKELENRQIGVQSPTEPTAGGEGNAKPQLTDEQRQLLEQMQADMRQRPTQLPEVPYNVPAQSHNDARQLQQHTQQPATQQPRNPFNNGATPASRPQEAATAAQPRQPEAKPQPKPEVKPPATVKQESKPEQKQQWMVQCGSFRATDQAESVRAQLAFAGIESRITTGGGWNRVMLGPCSSRAAADKALARLKGAGMSNCIPLAVGG